MADCQQYSYLVHYIKRVFASTSRNPQSSEDEWASQISSTPCKAILTHKVLVISTVYYYWIIIFWGLFPALFLSQITNTVGKCYAPTAKLWLPRPSATSVWASHRSCHIDKIMIHWGFPPICWGWRWVWKSWCTLCWWPLHRVVSWTRRTIFWVGKPSVPYFMFLQFLHFLFFCGSPP